MNGIVMAACAVLVDLRDLDERAHVDEEHLQLHRHLPCQAYVSRSSKSVKPVSVLVKRLLTEIKNINRRP